MVTHCEGHNASARTSQAARQATQGNEFNRWLPACRCGSSAPPGPLLGGSGLLLAYRPRSAGCAWASAASHGRADRSTRSAQAIICSRGFSSRKPPPSQPQTLVELLVALQKNPKPRALLEPNGSAPIAATAVVLAELRPDQNDRRSEREVTPAAHTIKPPESKPCTDGPSPISSRAGRKQAQRQLAGAQGEKRRESTQQARCPPSNQGCCRFGLLLADSYKARRGATEAISSDRSRQKTIPTAMEPSLALALLIKHGAARPRPP